MQLPHPERDNPLLESSDIETHDGQIGLKGNLVLLSLNLSRNYLTLITVQEFLRSIQHQTKLTHFNDAASFASTTASLIEFSGLCRLELKVTKWKYLKNFFFHKTIFCFQGMIDISNKSIAYQTLESLLLQKSPITRFQQIKDREAKDLHEQQTGPVPPPASSEKIRVSSSVKSSSKIHPSSSRSM